MQIGVLGEVVQQVPDLDAARIVNAEVGAFGTLEGLFRHLEAVEAQGAGDHHIPAGRRRYGQVAGRQGQGQVVVDAVSRGGAAAVPIVQFRQAQIQEAGDAPDGGGIIDGGSF